MNKERSPSLFLPLFTGVLLLFIILSGITEVACLASYSGKTNQSKLTNKTQSLQKMLPSGAVADVLSK
jgi:hypothetical protein